MTIAVLGIDTSSTDLGIGLVIDSRPAAAFSRYTGGSHAEHIASAVAMMLSINGIKPSDLDRIAVAAGPGSFTGLRIGMAFVKGFCLGRRSLVLPLSSLYVLAHAACRNHGRIFAAIEARNNEVFWASFSPDPGLTRLTDDSVTHLDSFLAGLSAADIVVVDALGYGKSVLGSEAGRICRIVDAGTAPLQRGLVCAAAGYAALETITKWCGAVELRPNYLRRSAAEERRPGTRAS